MSKTRATGQTIILDSVFIVDGINVIRKKIDGALAKKGKLTIKSKSEISELDLAAIQLLQYTKEQCQLSKKELKFEIKLSPDVLQLTKKTGVQNVLQIKN